MLNKPRTLEGDIWLYDPTMDSKVVNDAGMLYEMSLDGTFLPDLGLASKYVGRMLDRKTKGSFMIKKHIYKHRRTQYLKRKFSVT